MSVERASVCPLDCPDTCSLTVTVEAAKIVKIRGSKANPYTAGVICAKVQNHYPDFVHGAGDSLRRCGAWARRARADSSGSPGGRHSTGSTTA